LAEGTGLEPASDTCAVVFGTTALPVRLPFRKELLLELAGAPGFEPRISGLESDGLPVSLRPRNFLVHVIGRTGDEFRISNLDGDFKSTIHLC
jgi:hypothetical protein